MLNDRFCFEFQLSFCFIVVDNHRHLLQRAMNFSRVKRRAKFTFDSSLEILSVLVPADILIYANHDATNAMNLEICALGSQFCFVKVNALLLIVSVPGAKILVPIPPKKLKFDSEFCL